MKIQEEFTQIIEVENVDAIIPFLKKLSKADKKELIPFLKKETSRLTKYIQEGNTWSQVGTKKQMDILKYAGYVCLNQKDFSSKFFYYETKVIDDVLGFYIPTWLSDYVINSNDGETYTEFTYLWVMEKMEKKLIKHDDSFMANLLCQSIFYQNRNDPRKEYRYKYTYHPENLEKYTITLKEHFWLVFQYETNIYHSERWYHFIDGVQKEQISWQKNILKLSDNKKLPRQRLLKESINATTRNFNRNLINWYIDLFLALEPSVNELLEIQDDLFQAFNSFQSKPINEVLKLCKKLVLEKGFDEKSFLENVPTLLASEIKSIVNSTLIILDKLGKKETESKNVIALLCCGAFLQTDKSIQSRASKIIKKLGDPSDEKLISELDMYQDELMSEAKEILKEFVQNRNSGEIPQVVEEDFEHQIVTLISNENKIELPKSLDDFIFLVSQILDGNASWHFDFLPAAILEFHNQIDLENAEKLLPAFQRAQQLVYNFGVNKRIGYLDNLLAHFFLEYMDILMKKYPESKGFRILIEERKKKEEKKKRDWSNYESPKVSLKNWHLGQKEEYYFPFKFLLEEALGKIRSNDNLPLLSTPTHQPFWINPSTYIERLNQYQKQNKTPNRVDWQIAISRLAIEHLEENIKLAKEKLKGEWLDLTLLALQEPITPPKKSKYLNEWKMAVYAKYPTLTSEQFKTQFPSFKVDKKLLGEFDINFSQVKTTKHVYNSKKKVYEEKPTLEAQLSIEGKYSYGYASILNRVISKFIKNSEKNFFLMEWIYIKESPFLGYANDIPRMLSLSPKNVQPIFSQIETQAMKYSTFWEEESKQLKLNAANVLLENWIGGGKIAHLFVATGMVCSDKTIRETCAGIWMKGVFENSINHNSLGQILGRLAAIDYFPLKRISDLITGSMLKISNHHNQKLEILLQEIIAQLPTGPMRNTKKLLEIFQEIINMNQSSVSDERLEVQLEKWKTNSSLKKVVADLLK